MTDEELKDLVASFAEDRKEVWQMLKETQRVADRANLVAERAFQAVEKAGQTVDKLGLKVDSVCGKLGGIDANIGFHSEQFFQDVFRKKKEFGGIKYDRIFTGSMSGERVKEEMEIDIMLSNGDSIALIEVKHRIHPSFVTEFAEKRVKKFRTYFPGFSGYKLYLGIAGFSFDKNVLDIAKENGIGIVKQVGEGVEIEAEHLKAY